MVRAYIYMLVNTGKGVWLAHYIARTACSAHAPLYDWLWFVSAIAYIYEGSSVYSVIPHVPFIAIGAEQPHTFTLKY